MTETIDQEMEALAELRLPELQHRFAELVGEETRSPNKTYLLRRIREELEQRAALRDAPLRDLDVDQLRARYEDPRRTIERARKELDVCRKRYDWRSTDFIRGASEEGHQYRFRPTEGARWVLVRPAESA